MFGKINDNGIFASDCDGNVGGSRVWENGTHGGIAKYNKRIYDLKRVFFFEINVDYNLYNSLRF